MAHANEALLSIDLRIRTLSSLISKLNQHIESPEFINHLQISPALVACNHIAILLTRGIEDSNNKLIGAGRKVVAVSGRLASTPTFIVSIDPYEDPAGVPPLSTAIVTQNPIPKDQSRFTINTLEPSPTPLEDMAAPPCVPSAPRLLFFSPRNHDVLVTVSTTTLSRVMLPIYWLPFGIWISSRMHSAL